MASAALRAKDSTLVPNAVILSEATDLASDLFYWDARECALA